MRRPKSQEKPCSTERHIDSMSNRRFKGNLESIVPFSSDLPEKTQFKRTQKDSPVDESTLENVTEQEHLPWREQIGSPQERLPKHDIKGLTPYQILGKLTSQT